MIEDATAARLERDWAPPPPIERGQSLILSGVEYFFACPYCSERISMVLDASVKRQTYIEDCEVCCAVKNDEVRQFEATAI